MAKILIIDDDKFVCEMVCKRLQALAHDAISAHTIADGMKEGSAPSLDLVLLDVRLPDGSGLEALPQFKALDSRPEIIIITGEGDPDGAKLAIETGAWDYIEKPLSMREVVLQVTRALEYRNEKIAFRSAILLKKEGIIGSDPKLEACLERVAQVAAVDTPVLISGETGTGKELFARAVHANSGRASGPFVVLDCAAFPEKLVESMLFGHRKGAFTGADHDRDGLILQANNGTLFMDEVGELTMPIQKAFLRVLQERRFRPIGGSGERTSNFRLVAATNRNLASMAAEGSFRKDLFFRLKSAEIHLPPLKERSSDIEALAMHFISSFCKNYGMHIKGVSRDFMQTLQTYSWPGNVRELVNALDASIANAKGHDVLVPMHLPVDIRVHLKCQKIQNRGSAALPPDTPESDPWKDLPTWKTSLEETEKHYFQSLMSRTEGNIKEACRISGLSRTALYERYKKHAIERPE